MSNNSDVLHRVQRCRTLLSAFDSASFALQNSVGDPRLDELTKQARSAADSAANATLALLRALEATPEYTRIRKRALEGIYDHDT